MKTEKNRIRYWLISCNFINLLRIFKCNNYGVCEYEGKGYKLKEFHQGRNFIIPACPKCKIGVMSAIQL